MSLLYIKTDQFSTRLRDRVFNPVEYKFLILNFNGTEQEKDLSLPANCDGFGRVHHFRRFSGPNWPLDPLPLDPALKCLNIDGKDPLRAQVFQLAACNWRCWYCFVDYKSLSASVKHASWLSTDDLITKYIKEVDVPKVIDLSGGQPDLAPEWVPSFMRSLQKNGLDKTTYLWSDDNLSTDYFWRYLNRQDFELIAGYTNYSRVGCFKGYNEASFSFNTNASPKLFHKQFEYMEHYVKFGLDIYAYATFTTPSIRNLETDIAVFVDRLQLLHPNFPLRTVPLEIKQFKANSKRFSKIPKEAVLNQYDVINAWRNELSKRYSEEDMNLNISDVSIK